MYAIQTHVLYFLFYFFRFLRSVAYRQYVRLVYEYVGASRRILLPNCGYNSIWQAFPNVDGEYTGYEEEEGEDKLFKTKFLLPLSTSKNSQMHFFLFFSNTCMECVISCAMYTK